MDEDTDETTGAVTDDLSNIPGIGPARKAVLYAAGITTRAALSQASVEQLVSLTGMPRTQAEKALETLHETDYPSLSAPSPQIVLPPVDEAMPAAGPAEEMAERTEAPLVPNEDANEAHSAQGLLYRATFRTKTALSDATRVWDFPKFSKSLVRLVTLLDSITETMANALRPKAAKRLTAQLETLSLWIEKELASDTPLKNKRRKRVRARLKSDRHAIESVLKAVRKKKSARSKEPKKRDK